MSKWFFAIDKGGTFTDIIGIDPQNKIHTCKILSHELPPSLELYNPLCPPDLHKGP